MEKRGFIFDLDGTIYLGNQLIEGADHAINLLLERGDNVVFFTNNSIATIDQYVKKLNSLGIAASRKNVINSNLLVKEYLNSKLKEEDSVLVIGEAPLVNKLKRSGIPLTSDENEATYVVLGWDRNFTYNKLNKAFQAWKRGAKILATNPDKTCPLEDGQVPDCGSMIGALEGATGEEIKVILGKPSKIAAEYIVNNLLNLPSDRCYIVGDRLETDIKMGEDFGLNSVLVLSGITDKQTLSKSKIKPKHIINTVKDIVYI